MKPDYYLILGVSKTADAAAIKLAFRKRAKELHPDLNKAPGATEAFMKVNEAYEILSDVRKRELYDYSLRPRPTYAPAPSPTQARDAQYQDWVAQAQARAQHYARMNYEQFHKSRFEKAEAAIFYQMQYLMIFVMLLLALMFFSLPFMAFAFVTWKGIFFAVFALPASFKIFEFARNGYREIKRSR